MACKVGERGDPAFGGFFHMPSLLAEFFQTLDQLLFRRILQQYDVVRFVLSNMRISEDFHEVSGVLVDLFGNIVELVVLGNGNNKCQEAAWIGTRGLALVVDIAAKGRWPSRRDRRKEAFS